MTAAIETSRLNRTYKSRDKKPDVVALDSFEMRVETGEIRGLLGPNGAGKSTLVKILSTALLPSSGWATVAGYDVVREAAAVRPVIGMMLGGERGLYWRLTGRQNLEYWAALYRVPRRVARDRVESLLGRVGLSERADYAVETYSRGMKQRLHLARSLVAEPRILFLDEPTNGLDPIAAHDFRSLVMELRAEGRTVLMATHDMAEAEAVCDRVTLINRGATVAEETPRSLSRLIAQRERIDFEGDAILADKVSAMAGVERVRQLAQSGYRVELQEQFALTAVLDLLVQSGVTSLRTSRPSLEEVYVQIMSGREAKAARSGV